MHLYREAKIEFGEAIAARLKLSRDGKKVLWPQPTDDPDDPQNVGLHILTPQSLRLSLFIYTNVAIPMIVE